MKNVLIIGAGRYGRYSAKQLHDLGHQVMIVDRNEEKINEVLSYVTTAEIGDSCNEVFLKSLGISDYDFCLVAIGDDFVSSLETTFLLFELGAKQIIARANNENQEKLLLRSGANHVVFPERELGIWTATRFSTDSIFNYFSLGEEYGIFEMNTPAKWDGKSIREIDIRHKYGITILAKKDVEFDFKIGVDTVLKKDEKLLVIGKNEHIQHIAMG